MDRIDKGLVNFDYAFIISELRAKVKQYQRTDTLCNKRITFRLSNHEEHQYILHMNHNDQDMI